MAAESRQIRAGLARVRPILAAVVIAAIAGVGGYGLGSAATRSSPTIGPSASLPAQSASPTPKPPPTIFPAAAIWPSSFSCSAPSVPTAFTIRLPASVPASTALYTSAGGAADAASGAGGLMIVGSQFSREEDGSWYWFDGDNSMFLCGVDPFGENTMSLFDEYGNEIARVTVFIYP